MPCNSTKPALQLITFDWGRLGHKLHPSNQLQRATCFHTGSVPRGLGVAPQEGTPQRYAWPGVPPSLTLHLTAKGWLEQCCAIANCWDCMARLAFRPLVPCFPIQRCSILLRQPRSPSRHAPSHSNPASKPAAPDCPVALICT